MLISFGLENLDLIDEDYDENELNDRVPFIKIVITNFSRNWSGVRFKNDEDMKSCDGSSPGMKGKVGIFIFLV